MVARTDALLLNSVWRPPGKLQYIAPTFVNPIEVGTPRDEERPGTGIVGKIGSDEALLEFSEYQDVIISGSISFLDPERRAPLIIRGGRNVLIRGIDMGFHRLVVKKSSGHLIIEGIRFDFSQIADVDAVINDGIIDLTECLAEFSVQRCEIIGIISGGISSKDVGGAFEINRIPVDTIARNADNTCTVTLEESIEVDTCFRVMDELVVCGTVPPDGCDQSASYNWNWRILDIDRSSTSTIKVDLGVDNLGFDLPKIGSSATNGFCWILQKPKFEV